MSNLVKNPWESIEDQIDGDIPSATLQIYQGIEAQLNRPKDNNVDRASSATMCVRRRWYQNQGVPQTPMAPRKIVNFLLGDLTEAVVVSLIKSSLVGPDKLYSEVDFGESKGKVKVQGHELEIFDQKTLYWKLSDTQTVTAHIDGLGKRNSDDQWELIEVKSAADFGYEEFRENGPGDYIKQSHACMMTEELMAKGVRSVRYFYLKKNTGHLWDRLIEFEGTIAQEVKMDFIRAKSNHIPNRPYFAKEETYYKKPTGRWVLPWQCGYCSFVQTCHPTAQKEFKKGQFGISKPVWVTKGEEK